MKERYAMKKILFVIGSLQTGGAETVLVDTINNLYNDFEITVLLIEKRGELIKSLNKSIKLKYLTLSDAECSNLFEKISNKIKLSLIYRVLSNNKMYIKQIYKKKLNEKYDTEVAFLAGVPSKIVKNSPNKKSKKIGWVHTTVKKDGSQTYKNYSNLKDGYDKIVAVSQESLDIFKKTFPETSDKLVLIHNFIDIDKIVFRARENVDIDFCKRKKNIISVGRVAEEKGYDRILNIAKKFENKINFYIIGDGNLKNEYNRQLKNNNIKNVTFLGLKNNPYPYIKKADAFLLSSRQEAYPTVVLEAMILNKSIIATKAAGVEEILKDYTDKILVENADNSIEAGIEKWLKGDNNKNKKLGAFEKENIENIKKIKEILN